MKTIVRHRSSITGRLVTKKFAEANPDTTERETYQNIKLTSTRVKESLSYLLDTLQDKATEEEINDLEQLKLLV